MAGNRKRPKGAPSGRRRRKLKGKGFKSPLSGIENKSVDAESYTGKKVQSMTGEIHAVLTK